MILNDSEDNSETVTDYILKKDMQRFQINDIEGEGPDILPADLRRCVHRQCCFTLYYLLRLLKKGGMFKIDKYQHYFSYKMIEKNIDITSAWLYIQSQPWGV